MKEYYTYAYLREDRTPYYIGKGSGNRAYKRTKRGEETKRKMSASIKIALQNRNKYS